MEIIYYKNGESLSSLCERLPFGKSGCVIALGFFDGVHIAHRALISHAKKEANKSSLPLVIFTFSGKDNNFKKTSERIYTDEEKCELLSECEADYTLICDFPSLSSLTKEEFVFDFLIKCLGAKCAVCGFNFRFGHGASGNASDLSRLCKEGGSSCITIDKFIYDNKIVSSTEIKKLIENKNIKTATALLGKPYFISGKVSHGCGIGKGMGLPTVNTDLQDDKFSPAGGVYVTAVNIDGSIYASLTNIGTCPTFGERKLHAETYILDFEGNIYNKSIKIYFIDFLRDERAFFDKKELLMQINVDKIRARKIIGATKWQEIGLNLQ